MFEHIKKNEHTLQFIKKIEDLNDCEYGDFKRKANQYVLDLRSQLTSAESSLNQSTLNQMQYEIQFLPSGDIEATRDQTLALARRML